MLFEKLQSKITSSCHNFPKFWTFQDAGEEVEAPADSNLPSSSKATSSRSTSQRTKEKRKKDESDEDDDDDDDDNDKEEKSDDDASFQADEVSHGSEEEPEQRRPKKNKRTTAGRPKGATRRQWPKDQEKALRKEFRKEMIEGRLPGQDVCLEAMKRYPHAQKWQDIKDKVRNMQVSDVRKRKLLEISKTFSLKLFYF